MSFEECLNCVIFIPAYNAEGTLASVLERIPQAPSGMSFLVCAINDGSTDNTRDVLSHMEKRYKALRIISFPKNRGYGSAVRAGLFLARSSGADYAVCLHADGQYPPEKIPIFIDYMQKHKLDILQGSRHKDGSALAGGMPIYKLIAGKALVWLENRIFGLDLSDYHSGFLFYSSKAVNGIPFDKLSNSFDFDLEVIASARQRGLHVDEIAIPTHYGTETSYLNPVTYGLRVLWVLCKFKMGGYK